MEIRLLLDYQTILANRPQLVHFALSFKANSLSTPRPRPAAFCIVLDQSGSMAGPPLATAKAASVEAIRNLRTDDQFGLVVFNQSAQVVLPLQPAKSKKAMVNAIERLEASGSTNLTGGWMLGRDELNKAPDGSARRLLILSDGHLNHGIVDPNQIKHIVQAGQETKGIRTSCLGFGDNYDEKLLADMARTTGGEFYDAASPERFPAIFTKELEGLQKISVQNLRVRIKPLDFCESYVQLSSYPGVALPDGRHEFALGDLVSEEEREVCFGVEVLPLPWIKGKPAASLEGEQLLEVEILHDEIEAEGITSRSMQRTVRIQATQNPAEVRLNETVVPWVAMQRAGQAFRQATEQAEVGCAKQALEVLAKAIASLQQYGVQDKAGPAIALLQELQNRLERGPLSERERKWSHHHHHRMTRSSSRHQDELQPPPPGPTPP